MKVKCEESGLTKPNSDDAECGPKNAFKKIYML